MQELKDKVQNIVSKYEQPLASKGIRIVVTKKYFEATVDENSGGGSSGNIFHWIDRAIDRKKENKKYHYENNKYHCFIISVMPLDKGLVRRDHRKDYAFVIRKVERAHIGIKPQRIAYKEAKLLAKIEKRILKILKKAETADIRKVCSDTLFDAFRYSSLNKYAYKNKILGKERFSWELIFLISSGIIAFFLAFLLWLIGKLC